MKVLVPLSSAEEFKDLIVLGADEFYFGISLVKDLDERRSINLRPHQFANLKNIKEAQRVIQLIHKYNRRCYLALNVDAIRPSLFSNALEILKELDIDGVIITDLILMKKIKERYPHLKLIASTRCNIFNFWSIRFYKKWGIKRFTLPRHLYFKDIIEILKTFKKEEFEIFVKNEDCPYINGMCVYIHNLNFSLNADEGAFCRVIERKGRFILIDKKKGLSSRFRDIYRRYEYCRSYNCGVCWLKKLLPFEERVILKITGRMLPLERKKRDLIFVKKAIEIIKRKGTCKEVIGLQKEIYPESCNQSCYFDFNGKKYLYF
jgi:putative protease